MFNYIYLNYRENVIKNKKNVEAYKKIKDSLIKKVWQNIINLKFMKI